MRLDRKVAVVTGGGRGIGRGIALCMAQAGAAVAIPDLNIECARRVAGEVVDLGRRSLPLETDVTLAGDVEEMVKRVLDEFGQLDILVNNAGVGTRPGLPFTNNVEEDWDNVYRVNVKAIFITSKAVAPHFIERRAGRIVNIASTAGLVASTTMPPYTVSKAGAILFTRIVAKELAPYGVTVNAVCPGFLWTPLWQEIGEHLAKTNAAYAGLTPRQVFEKRRAELAPATCELIPEDIGWATVFFASDMARQITGQVLCIDGGAGA